MFAKGKKRPPVIRIGGRAFRNVEFGKHKVSHQLYFERVEKEAQLDHAPKRAPGETEEQYGERLLVQLRTSGQALQMLGALILPADKSERDWTPAMAEATAAFLGEQTSPEDHATINSLLLSTWLAFFSRGMASSEPSRTSSKESHPGNQESGSAVSSTRSATANGVA